MVLSHLSDTIPTLTENDSHRERAKNVQAAEDNISHNICNVPVEVVLPSPAKTSSTIEEAVWGVLKGTDITTAVNDAYSKVVKWKKNLFRVPSGKAGQEFI